MNLNISASAAATAEALLIHSMQKPEEQQAKRDLFEDIAYAHYCERWLGQNPIGMFTKEELCARNPEQPERYHYSDMNTSWWGFQAGFMAAALQGAKVKS